MESVTRGSSLFQYHIREFKMGRWLSKKDYAKRAKRIVELREKDELEFADIAKRMGILQGVVEYSYRKSKREEK